MNQNGYPSEEDFRTAVDENVMDPPPMGAGWVFRTMRDAYAERPPLEYLVEGLVPKPSVCIFYGAPGSLKSMILLDLAVCVAKGSEWLAAMPGGPEASQTFQTTQANVMWLDFDNGGDLTASRFEAIGRGHDADEDLPVHYISMPLPWLNMTDPAHVVNLMEEIRRKDIGLLVIDNLGQVAGNSDENSADMQTVMGGFRLVAEKTRCAIIVVHHQRKASSADQAVGATVAERLRGHSSINAALDLAIHVHRKGTSNEIALTAAKVRYYTEFERCGAMFTYDHKEDSYDMAQARFWSRRTEGEGVETNAQIEAVIMREIADMKEPATKAAIAQLVRDRIAAQPGSKPPGVNKVRGLVGKLWEDGKLSAYPDPEQPGNKNHWRYFVDEKTGVFRG